MTRRDQYPHFAPLTAAVSVLAARPDVTLAYVFGSTARGERRADSDIDIAVLFDVQPSATEQLALRDALCAAAQIPVDLVVLNDASPLLAHEVISAVGAYPSQQGFSRQDERRAWHRSDQVGSCGDEDALKLSAWETFVGRDVSPK